MLSSSKATCAPRRQMPRPAVSAPQAGTVFVMSRVRSLAWTVFVLVAVMAMLLGVFPGTWLGDDTIGGTPKGSDELATVAARSHARESPLPHSARAERWVWLACGSQARIRVRSRFRSGDRFVGLPRVRSAHDRRAADRTAAEPGPPSIRNCGVLHVSSAEPSPTLQCSLRRTAPRRRRACGSRS